MIIINGYRNYHNDERNTYLALGNFDGVHKGHQELINTAVTKAHSNSGVAAAMIFNPHPTLVLNPAKAPLLLMTENQQSEMLGKLNLDVLVYTPFDKEISALSPERFVQDILVAVFKVKEVFIGFNYSFGFKASGTPELLKELGQKYGFAVTVIPAFKIDSQIVSSSLVRALLAEGNIKEAWKMLGHFPQIEGLVVEGERRGRTIGFPTANIGVEQGYMIPGKGVYAAITEIDGVRHHSVVNIGSKPTFHVEYPISIETHIIDFTESIYGKKIRLHFLDKIRDEKKFGGIDELVRQISLDKEKALQICKASALKI